MRMLRRVLLLVFSLVCASEAATVASLPPRGRRPGRLLRSTTFQGASLFCAADLLSQALVKSSPPPSAKERFERTASFTLFGGAWVGTVNANWYKFIDRRAAFPNAGLSLLTKVAATWVALGLVGNSVNMGYQRLVVDHDAKKALAYVRDNAKEVILNDAKVWPLFDILVFTVVPPAARATSVVIASLSWNTYINIASHRTS